MNDPFWVLTGFGGDDAHYECRTCSVLYGKRTILSVFDMAQWVLGTHLDIAYRVHRAGLFV